MLNYIRSFCIHPEPEVRVQMQLQTLHFSLPPRPVVVVPPRDTLVFKPQRPGKRRGSDRLPEAEPHAT